MPAWLQADGAWIAILVTLITIAMALGMHQAIRKVLRAPQPESDRPTNEH